MRFTVAATAAFVAGASASYGYGYPAVNSTSAVYSATPTPSDVYETTVVTQLTTVCPTPTEVTYGGKTYTVTESTTLTITDCPCTISYPVKPTPAPPAYTPSAPAPVSSAPAPPAAPYPSSNGTVPSAPAPVYPTGTGVAPSGTPKPPQFTGAANKVAGSALALGAAIAAFL